MLSLNKNIFANRTIFFLSPRWPPKLLLQTVLTQVDLETRLYEYKKIGGGCEIIIVFCLNYDA